MRILFVSAEVAPFAKVGGLGDVAAALPRHLHARGHDVRVFVPLYRRARAGPYEFEAVPGLENLQMSIGHHSVRFSVVQASLPGTKLGIYFVHCPALYDREAIYTQDHDEHFRFIVLSWAALVACQHLGFSPEICHANDWQTALLPLLLRTRFDWDRQRFGDTRTLLTIHNLMHQGVFGAATLGDTGMADSAHLFHQDQLQAGMINFLLTGILYAGAVTTVSPTYAKEIQSDEMGAGLAPFLRARSSTVVGVLNGIDESEWSPESDLHIARRYSRGSLSAKEYNKQALLENLGLPYAREIPVVGIVSRFVGQKGLDLVPEALIPLLARGRLQLTVLGSGDASLEARFAALQSRFRKHVCFYRGFSNPLAHMIEAGADIFLMPSRYEPCGLNQMYSLRYGTVPIVRKTGGLADTVEPFNRNTGSGTGFVFREISPEALYRALTEALTVWPDRRAWRQLQDNGMSRDYSWNTQVATYETVYRRLQEM